MKKLICCLVLVLLMGIVNVASAKRWCYVMENTRQNRIKNFEIIAKTGQQASCVARSLDGQFPSYTSTYLLQGGCQRQSPPRFISSHEDVQHYGQCR